LMSASRSSAACSCQSGCRRTSRWVIDTTRPPRDSRYWCARARPTVAVAASRAPGRLPMQITRWPAVRQRHVSQRATSAFVTCGAGASGGSAHQTIQPWVSPENSRIHRERGGIRGTRILSACIGPPRVGSATQPAWRASAR
jgi:hypothetical protein